MDFSQWYSGDMTPPMAAGSQLVPAPRKGLLAALETSWQEPRLKGLAALLLASNAAKNGAEGGKAKQHAWQPVDGGAPGGGGWGNTEWQPPGAILPIQFGSGGQVRFAIPQMLNSLISGVTLPGDVMAGRVNMSGSPTQWDPEAFGRAVDFTTSVGAGGLASPKPANALGIFGGELAKTADRTALAAAKEMAEKGVSRDEIWNQTGWFKGVDGKWRFEIDDSASRITGKALAELTSGDGGLSGGTQRTGAGTLQHKALFDAYPQLRNADVDARYNADLPANRGSFTYAEDRGGRPSIVSETNALFGPQGTHGVLLHEFDHGVQDLEGFARGATVGEYARGPMFSKEANSLKDDLTLAVYGGKLIPTQPKELLDLLKYADPTDIEAVAARHGFNSVEDAASFLRHQDELRTPFSQYQRTAGEVSARNTQARMALTPEQRRAMAPWTTQDVPDENQIVRSQSDRASFNQSLLDALAKGKPNGL